jgi:hypothetical protein
MPVRGIRGLPGGGGGGKNWRISLRFKHDMPFVVDIAVRRVHVAGTTVNPNSSWMARIARNLTDCVVTREGSGRAATLYPYKRSIPGSVYQTWLS